MFIETFAPGRVELLGNHTDYNQGFVLSGAISAGVTLNGREAGSAEGAHFQLSSKDFPDALTVSADDLESHRRDHWTSYPLGVARELMRAGFKLRSFEAEISSDLPIGAGLSSSAALEVSTAKFLLTLIDQELDNLELAKLCQRAENEYVGMNCGLLDQVSSVFGKADHVIYLDCLYETVTTVPVPGGVEVLVCHTGAPHRLVGGEYNERREQCFAAAAKLGVSSLREIDGLDELENRAAELSELELSRARHIVGENERVQRGIEALRIEDVATFGQLMFQSHESSQQNFDNSTAELDLLVEIARKTEGIFGARLTGGGFGGAIVAIAAKEKASQIQEQLPREYTARSGHRGKAYLFRLADGARVLSS